MLKILYTGKRTLLQLHKAIIQKRFLLSPAYACKEEWNQRLNSDLLQKTNIRDMLNDIESVYQAKEAVSALDIDIFANKVETESYLNDIIIILQRLRLTAQTSNMLESTHHAVIRYLMDLKKYDILITMLHDRLKYGIFPDHLCYNMMMDTFLENKDYAKAVQIAVLPMLQEDSENQLTNAFALYACGKYMDDPSIWPEPEEKPPEDTEVVKVRVDYIRNPYFDEHFDLTKPKHLVGKTLIFHGKQATGILQRSLLLRGMLLFEKYHELQELMNAWRCSIDQVILYSDDIKFAQTLLSGLTDEQPELQTLVNEIQLDSRFAEETLPSALHNNLMSKLSIAENDIHSYREKYCEWNKMRDAEFERQKYEYGKQLALKRIEKKKEELAKEEQLLTFFDKEEEIELAIQEKAAQQKKDVAKVHNMVRSARKLKKLVACDTYVPPELLEGIEIKKK